MGRAEMQRRRNRYLRNEKEKTIPVSQEAKWLSG
jgi:hypothetical protein